VTALTDQPIEFGAQSLEVGDLALYVRKMGFSNRVNFFAGSFPVVRKPEQLTNFIE
jgi:hypothetical protein